jgi:L-fucose isomerase-like protein
MVSNKTTFALFFGNRSFFPASLQASARKQMQQSLKKLGHKTMVLNSKATRHGAVETPEEGQRYANFLRKNEGKYGGVILCLPNFGDETGAVAALKDSGVPILVQAYPDDPDKMAPALRRDAFCGKFSVMDVFCQYDVLFTALTPHTVHPGSKAFASNVDYFDRLCRVYNGMKEIVVGAIGARTTAFKTVRFDELALQRYGVTIETLDLSDIFARVKALKSSSAKVKRKIELLKKTCSWKGVPKEACEKLAKLAVVLDEVIREYRMDALAFRCWIEIQQQLGISPCVLLGLLNERRIAAACEVDVGNAVAMRALSLASGKAPACLDLNNNYGNEENKCILFHCGSVPSSLMTNKGRITDHAILMNAVGEGCGYGCRQGRITPMQFTYGSVKTEDGQVCMYLGEGRFTDDPIADDYFGCAGVAEIPGLQEKLQAIGYLGYRHHTSITPGHVAEPMYEALEKYLGYEVTLL